MKPTIIRISRGAQFRNGNAALPFFVLLALLIGFFLFLSYRQYFSAFFLLALMAVIALFTFDIQGVEIDTRNNKIKDYKLYLWGRIGEWKDFSGYYEMRLDLESYLVKNYQFYTALVEPGQKRISYDPDRRFIAVLVNKNPKRNLILAESDDYHLAAKKLREIAKKLNLPYYDDFASRIRQNTSGPALRI